MLKNLCHIACLDAVDFCVLTNLRIMFRRLGFRVTWSKQVRRCNILVVMRAEQISPDDLEHVSEQTPVIVFGYVGKPCEVVISQLKKRNCSILFVPASEQLPPQNDGTFDTLIAPPPVYPEMWMRPILKDAFIYAYLGNRKQLGTDQWQQRLEGWIDSGQVDVWGRWWSGHCPDIRRHGAVSIFTVPEIYRRSIYSLGLMYPFQRDMKTFSGRYWLAPLCGAHVLAETDSYSDVPGVLVYKAPDLPVNRFSLEDRSDLQQKARLYWKHRTERLEAAVGDWIQKKIDPTRLEPIIPGLDGIKEQATVAILKISSRFEAIGVAKGINLSPFSLLGIWR